MCSTRSAAALDFEKRVRVKASREARNPSLDHERLQESRRLLRDL